MRGGAVTTVCGRTSHLPRAPRPWALRRLSAPRGLTSPRARAIGTGLPDRFRTDSRCCSVRRRVRVRGGGAARASPPLRRALEPIFPGPFPNPQPAPRIRETAVPYHIIAPEERSMHPTYRARSLANSVLCPLAVVLLAAVVVAAPRRRAAVRPRRRRGHRRRRDGRRPVRQPLHDHQQRRSGAEQHPDQAGESTRTTSRARVTSTSGPARRTRAPVTLRPAPCSAPPS